MRDASPTLATLDTATGPVDYHSLVALEDQGLGDVSGLPRSIKVLLEAVARQIDGVTVTQDHVARLAAWGTSPGGFDVPFSPARVLLQDFTGVPAVVDLAALRSALAAHGGDPTLINPRVPADLVIDHSVQVDAFGSEAALAVNARREFERNGERYEFLHWGQGAFDAFRVVPPASGIVHQVNLEHLATVVVRRPGEAGPVAFPDSLVGTDSHTTMINGLGVLGWGVGGIEAEAALLGQPIYMLAPEVVGFELKGHLPDGATATDLVLTVTQALRRHGVVGKFVEFFGDGIASLSLPDRATLANMCPEYGATVGFFAVDDETLRYLRATGRGPDLVDLVERYTKAQGLFRRPGEAIPRFTATLALDMGSVVPSLAGPTRPQDRIPLTESKRYFREALPALVDPGARRGNQGDGEARDIPTYPQPRAIANLDGVRVELGHGTVVIAAITSCTNTSNPSVMIAAGLLAKKAVEAGLDRRPWVKTSLAPGSRVVTRYLAASGCLPYLEALGFHVVGYGCTTCIGNSGPLPEAVAAAVEGNDLVATAVLSGNRNFEGRINPHVRGNYLASPPLVVAYALAGTMDIDLATEPLGHAPDGRPVFLKEVWPAQDEVRALMADSLAPGMFEAEYAHIFQGDDAWNAIDSGGGVLFPWRPDSTYVREPPFFLNVTPDEPAKEPISGARVLVLLGDSITTDHISPAGAIPSTSPAGQYLKDHGVAPRDFNSFGSRRGNHEVMMRGTFGNIRLRNHLVPGTEGGFTAHLPVGDIMSIYDAAARYGEAGVPLVVLAGSEYGTGSSRDWAAKGPALLGVEAVIANSFERIHRSNLIGMGILPLEFHAGAGWRDLGLTGREVYDIDIPADLRPRQEIEVTATDDGGQTRRFNVTARVDSDVEVSYYKNGGILHTVLREMLRGTAGRG